MANPVRVRNLGRRVRSTLAGALLLTAAALVAPLTPTAPVRAAAAPSAAYVAVQPCRLADTRLNSGYTTIDSATLQVITRGVCGIPAAATSLALTLTVINPQGPGYLTAWPADQARPTSSNVNFTAGQVRANGAITRVDSNGALRVYTSVPAQVVVDVVGAFIPATSSAAGRFVPRSPTRLFDSRVGAKFAPGSSFTLPLPSGLPSDATAVALNVTVTEATGPGYVTEFAAGHVMPTSSILNVDAIDQTRAAAGIFPVSSSGLSMYLSGGGHVVVDLLGYFTGKSAPTGSDGLYTAYDPTRLIDTRGASPLGNGVPVYPGGGVEVPSALGGSLVYNITSVGGDAGYLTAYAAGTSRPTTSSVNSVGFGDTVANFGITQISDRGMAIYSQSTTHVLVDLQGWFSGPSLAAVQPPPANTPPPPPPTPPTPQPTLSGCMTGSLSTFNSTRASIKVPTLAFNPAAQAFACGYAIQLARNNQGLVHSDPATRDAALGCPSGENLAVGGGTSASALIKMWYASPPHLANIKFAAYRSAGFAYVTTTAPDGTTMIWGVVDFSTC